jgi:hypothetical protein
MTMTDEEFQRWEDAGDDASWWPDDTVWTFEDGSIAEREVKVALATGEWPDLEQSRAILADYVEGHEIGPSAELPEDSTPGAED